MHRHLILHFQKVNAFFFPFRGLPSMMQIVFNEIDSLPSFFQTAFSYLKKATVVVPVMAVLGYV